MATPEDLAYIAQHPLLQAPGDRRALLTLLAGPRQRADAPSRPVTVIGGVSIQRAVPTGPRRIYRTFGSGGVLAPADLTFEALSNLSLIPAWDLLFKGARYLQWSRDARGGGAVETGRIHLAYGLPGGVTRFIHDRDFVLRALRVFFPSGLCCLCCRSVAPADAADGDPAPGRNTIRGWMWASGYVVVPADDGACRVDMSLQVDPKGWVPAAIVNMSLEAIPLNLTRLRGTLARLPPEFARRLGQLNLQQARSAKPDAASDAAASSAAAGGRGGGGGGQDDGEDEVSSEGPEGDVGGSGSGDCGGWQAARESWGGREEGEEEEGEEGEGAPEAPKRARLSA